MINENPASRFPRIVGGKQKRQRRRAAFKPQHVSLEDRCMLSGGVPIPTTNSNVALSTMFWNGEATPLNPGGKPNIPSPAAAGAMKTITITNSSSDMIYPFLRGQNIGVDPNAAPKAPYDPQDRVDHEFREYIGYSTPNGKGYLGLPSGASITIQVPLVLWDGDNLYLATDGKFLTSSNIFGYDSGASISIAAGSPVSGTTWMQGSNGYRAGESPLVMFYYSGGAPLTLPNDATAQLTEVTFRDPYLKYFINDKNQTFPLINYDVSYVNNMVAPISMEASHVPITYGDPQGATPPEYFGYQDFGWLATNQNTTTFENAIKYFINNVGPSSIGQYFGGKGWPQYYNPTPGEYDIPAGSNLFANSPLNTGPHIVNASSYDSNRWQLTSSGDAPIQAGGAGVGVQGYVYEATPDRVYLNGLPATFVRDLSQMLSVGAVELAYPGSTDVLAQVSGYVPNPGGMPYVTLKSAAPLSGTSGEVYQFTRTASDYATPAITNLWYSWAQYYVQQYQYFAPESVKATLGFTGSYASNVITLASTPSVPLAVGMTVTSPTGSGIPQGTTILKIDGDRIYLSKIPADDTPPIQLYTFEKPQPIQYDPQYTTPYTLSFDAAAAPNAKLFAGSVYAAMSAEAGVNPLPASYLPNSLNLVSQVIQFYAKLPGYDRANNPTGNLLVGQVRDVVKSILRGVYDFNVIKDQTLWYPSPGSKTPGLTSGQQFNVFNLDPYVWFVHDVQKMSAYGFSIDDDVANPTATGPLLTAGGTPNHDPNNLQIEFGGAGRLGNPNQWFPTIPWGAITTKATISIQPDGNYAGQSIITFTGPDALKFYNQINNPGDGQVGASISAPGYITAGTTVIFKGPTSGALPQIVLSKPAKLTDTPISVTITALPQPALTHTPLSRVPHATSIGRFRGDERDAPWSRLREPATGAGMGGVGGAEVPHHRLMPIHRVPMHGMRSSDDRPTVFPWLRKQNAD